MRSIESRSGCLPAIAIEPPAAKEHGPARIEALWKGLLPRHDCRQGFVFKISDPQSPPWEPSTLLGRFDIRTRLFNASLRKFGFHF